MTTVQPLMLCPVRDDEDATLALLSLCEQMSPRASPRRSPQGSSCRVTVSTGPWCFGGDVTPGDVMSAADRDAARALLEANFRRFYASTEGADGAQTPPRWEEMVQRMEDDAWSSAAGDSETYWMLLRQAVSIAVAEHCSPQPTSGRSADTNALRQRANGVDATPARGPKRRKLGTAAGGTGISPKAASVPWSDQDDEALKDFVQSIGTKWTLIGSKFKRTGKQCRERWCNHVDPNVSHEPWTDAEDRILLHAHDELGNQWVEVAKRLPGRPYNAVKNRFNKASLREKFKGARTPSPGPPRLMTDDE